MWVEAISKRTKVPVETLWNIARSASRSYYEFTIKKSDGSDRLIQHPSRPLKAVQRLINRNLVARASVHESATAYSKGSKISHNAERHLGSNFTTRLDFRDFFPSFDAPAISNFFRELSHAQSLGLDNEDIDFVTRITCRNGSLVIGAPSSPKITNAMMYDFDSQVSAITDEIGVVYSRYADDIFISAMKKNILVDVEAQIREIIKSHSQPVLALKDGKTLYLSKAGHRSVTGLVLTPDGHLSLGRNRKRAIRTMTFLALNGKLTKSETLRLAGLLSFASDNEPDFIASLSKKFNLDIVRWFKDGCPANG